MINLLLDRSLVDVETDDVDNALTTPSLSSDTDVRDDDILDDPDDISLANSGRYSNQFL